MRFTDETVLSAIQHGHKRLRFIVRRTNMQDRIVDKALQRLRRKGYIRYRPRTGWEVTQPTHLTEGIE